jgi:alcohol dehydrogenase class IV
VLFDAVCGEPTLDVVQAAVDVARREGVEVVIGMGGGSAIDVGKATAVLCNKPGTVQEYHRGRAIDDPGLSFVSVPTTAGTGSEVTNNAVLTDPEDGVKKSIRGPHLYAVAAIVDPELTLSLPPEATASSGADALCQAIESFTAQGAQPASDALAGQAIRRIGRSLVRAWEQGGDVSARADMLYGSLFAGMSMTNTRLGGAHGMAHPLGFHYHISHGILCGLLLPYVMEYSLGYAPEKYAAVAALLGVNTDGMTAEEAAEEATTAVRLILDTIGIPGHLSGLGVKKEGFATIVQESLGSANIRNNARPLEGDDLHAILARAY